LLVALHSGPHALELIDGTGWELPEVSPPTVHIQHHIACARERDA
jgi:hypothetical protein